MALNNLTRIGNSGFGTDTSINTTGIVTAASFSGDGSGLTGITAVGSGVVVREEGSNVGTAQTINFIGTGVTATISGGIASIEIATSGGGGGGLSDVVSDTTPQLGGNLDVNGKDITGTGGVNLTGVVTATTFVGALTGNASGNAATATTLQNARTIGGVSFDGSANINLPGVNAAGNQDTSGIASVATNVTVANEASDTECFVMFGVNATGNNAPKSSSSLKYNSSSGGLTAGSFIGDGSGLTGITASGSGVIVRDGGSLVGTAGTIDFGSNVSVSPISAGVVTVTASAGSIPGINTSGTTEVNNLTATGVITATSFNGNGASVTNVNAVSIGGTPLTDLQKKNADTDLVMFNQILHFGPANTKSRIRWSGTTSLWDLIDGDLKIRDNTTDRFTFERTTGNFSASNVNVSGIITASSFSGSGANLTNLPASGISTAFTNIQATWSVGGDTNGYTFTGPGQDGAEQNPDIYLVRGQKYRFINSTGSGHPFAIRVSDGGAAYTDGVSGSQSGTQDFSVQHDAPVRLVYQCTIHSGMKGNIYIVGGSDWRMTDVTTAQTPEIFTNLNVGIGTDNPDASLHIHNNTSASFDAICLSGSVKRQNLIKVNNSDNLIVSVDEDDEGNDSQFRLQIDGSEKIRVKSTGLVGINTTTPQSRLEVFTDDDTDFGDSSNTNNTNSLIRLFNKNGTDNTAVNNYVGIRFDVANGATSSAWLSYVRTGNNAGAFQFKARNGASSYPEVARILSSGGITFGGDTAQDNALDDYEEGTLSWRLQRSDNIGAGSNVNTRVTYTKIGNRVYISGYIYTQNTGSSTSNVNIIIRSDSNTSNVATLPYLPNHSGGFSVTGTRTISDNYRNMAVTFQENSSTVYLYKDDGDNNYVKNTNNVVVGSSQTHLVLQFCGSYTTNS